MKNIILTIFVAIALSIAIPVYSNPEITDTNIYPEPEIFAKNALLIFEDNDQIAFSKNPYDRVYPASTTKIMTALIALENLELSKTVTIGDNPPFIGGSMLVMDVGEIFTVEQLIYGLLIPSGNDCAIALAEEVAGSTEAFAILMNEKATELGALNTHFVNPHGLHDNNHFTTPYDMYLIAKAAMKNETFRKIVSTPMYEIPPTNKQSETRYIISTNKLFPDLQGSERIINVNGFNVTTAYPAVIGIKSGWTDEAGRCLITAAKENDVTVYSMVFGSDNENIFQDSVRLLDYGLKGFKRESVYKEGENLYSFTLNDPSKSNVRLIIKNELNCYIPIDLKPENINEYFDIKFIVDDKALPPIDKNRPLGKVILLNKYQKENSLSANLYSDSVIKGVPLLNDEINKGNSPIKINYRRIIINIIIFIFLSAALTKLFIRKK